MSTKTKIKAKCRALEKLLCNKNDRYGNASLEPINVFFSGNSVSSIKARIDDKLKRIQNSGKLDDTEDTLLDLTGYLILLMIAKDNESHDIQKRIREDDTTSHPTTSSVTKDTDWEVEYTGI